MKNKILLYASIVIGLFAASAATAATAWSTQDYDLYPGDFDADGKTDLLYVAKDAAKVSGIARSDGSAPNIPFQSWPGNYLGIPWHGNVYSVLVADFNGDQRADLFLQRNTPGDSFLLFADAHGKISGIAQTVGYSALGLYWSADQHKIVAGDFNGDARADLFLQATSPSGANAVVLADANGQFTSGSSQQSWTDSSWGAFRWSTRNSNVFVGDFNGDHRDDLLLQARPNMVLIDYEILIPVPTYPPNSNGVVLSQGGAAPFQQAGVQQWSRNANGVDWSPNAAHIIVGDFDNNDRDDVLLQARNSGRPSYLLSGNAAGAALGSGSALATNVTWAADSYRLAAGNFDGSGGAGVYYQALSSAGTNACANVITSASVSISTHNPDAATGVLPTSAVGHTVGSFAVSDSGAATYSIPIAVPPGVAGMQPALSINYASGSGNGLLGVGWGLGGLSEISRCGKTLVQDNSTDAVQLSLNDRFCLDGNKLRLTGGAYGGAGSTYQTEIETFARVTANGTAGNGPAWFRVEARNGLIYEYGNSADSRIESLNSSASTTAHTWALNKVTDRAGNYMTIAYQEDGSPNGGHRPLTVTYTANTAASLSAAYKVNLHWELRPASDKLMSYVAGGVVREGYRLNRIETQYNEPGTGWRLVRKYQFSYNASGVSARSRLAAIQECDQDANCLAPTIISWQEGAYGWSTTNIGSITLPASASTNLPIDMNGDGRADFAYFDSTSATWKVLFANADGTYAAAINTGFGSATYYTLALPIDVNADGRRDLIVPHTDNTWWWLRYNGSSFSTNSTGVPFTGSNVANFTTADVNGDGLDDLVSASSTTVYIHTNQSSINTASFGVATAAWTAPADTTLSGAAFGSSVNLYNTPIQTADFDADGRADVLTVTRESVCGSETGCTAHDLYTWRALQSTGTALVLKTSMLATHFTQPTRPMFADINVDGRQDLVYAAGSSTKTWRYRLGTGGAVGTLQFLQAEVDTGVQTGVSGAGLISDCDSDGHTDLIFFWDGTYRCMRSNGESLDAPVDLGIFGPYKVADVNGDGLLDFTYLDDSSVLKVRLHRGVTSDFVSSIADGFGNTVNVTYAPLTDPTVYTKGSGAVFPEVDVQAAMYVVKQTSVSDGIGGAYSVSESYAGARVHAQGRGFLGFASRTSIDGRTGIRSTSSFLQTFPHIGFVSQSTTYQSSGGFPIAQVTNTPAVVVTSNTVYNERKLSYIAQSVQRSYEVGGAGNGQPIAQVTQTTTLNSNGDPTNITSTTADQTGSGLSYTTSTTNSYAPADNTNWCLSFVERQQVQNTVSIYGAQTRTVDYVKDTTNLYACRVHQEIVEPTDATGTMKVTTTMGYDVFGHPNSQTVSAANVAPRVTTASYGPQGVFPTSMTNALNQTAAKIYDYALGVPLSATDPNGLQVLWQYDGFGRLFRETRPDNTKTTWSYGACTIGNGYCGDNRLRYQVEKQELDASNGVIRSSRQLLDAYGRSLYDQSQTLSGAFATVATHYDNQGRAWQRSQPYFSGYPAYFTTVSYDLIGRPTQEQRRISEANSGTQTISYGYNRLTQSQTDANGKVTTKLSNAIGQVVQMTDAASGVTKYEYDSFGNLKKTIDPLNNEIRNDFNLRGFKTRSRDPDMGTWNYTFYPTGELWTQSDAKSQPVTFTYDGLSRPATRVEPEGATTFNYGASATLRNIGKLESVSAPGAYSESYVYDSLGRLQDATTNADATSFVVSNTYNAATGFLETTTYPASTSAVPDSRFKVKYEYANGLLQRTRDFNSPSTIYWEQIATNAAGQTIDEQYGNGLHSYSTYDGVTGLLGTRTAGATAQVQNLTYQWDKVGNLTQRRDHNLNLTEDFYYDDLYRLDYSKLNGMTNSDAAYDSLGNITSMTGVGSYTYPASGTNSIRPHAVSAAGANGYSYDDNGNMTSRAGSTITWYSYNKPNLINQGGNSSQFFYGADRSRYKQIAVTAAGGSLPAGTETTVYAGGIFEKVTKPSGVIEYQHYIMAGQEAVAIRTLRTNSANDTRYLHKDHLGSVDTITNESGSVVQRLSYDAFGKRRNATAWAGALPAADWTSIAALTHRGFTFHEHLDNVDLVHMNGRVYDPNIGRFISADPFIQAPLMSQSLNRYSYVINNPLSLIDPSGYSWLSKQFKSLRRHAHAHLRFLVNPSPRNFFESIKSTPGQRSIDRYVMTHEWAYRVGYAIAVVASYWIGGYGGAVYQSYYSYIATGSTTQALIAGVMAAAQQYAGNYMRTGSGFSMSSGGGVTVLSAAQTEASVSAGPNLFGMLMNAFLRAPAAPTANSTLTPGDLEQRVLALVPRVHAALGEYVKNSGAAWNADDFLSYVDKYEFVGGVTKYDVGNNGQQVPVLAEHIWKLSWTTFYVDPIVQANLVSDVALGRMMLHEYRHSFLVNQYLNRQSTVAEKLGPHDSRVSEIDANNFSSSVMRYFK